MALRGLTTVGLFLVLPLVLARRGHVRFGEGFQLRWPGVVPIVAAMILGLSLWPIDAEIALLLRAMGIDSLLPSMRDQIKIELASWSQELINKNGVIVPLLVLGVLPAICEELTFRGYLQRSLQERMKPMQAVLLSAFLFGLFHILMGGILIVERFFSSALMGLVLGWVCWRTRSVIPGIVLHTLHNSFLVALAYYAYDGNVKLPSWLPAQEAHPQWFWIVGAIVGTAGGLGVIQLFSSRSRTAPPVPG
jgi:ABC-2 type transport system permease protein/sodium transport system permease protein